MIIACAADAAFELPLYVLLHSVLANAGQAAGYRFAVLDGGLSERCRTAVSELARRHHAEVKFMRPNNAMFGGVRVSRQFPVTAWYRLLLPHLFPGDEKILYLDVDVLVNRPLAPLWTVHLGRSYLGACLSSLGVVANSSIAKAPEMIGKLDRPYFNSGVMLMNLAAMREAQVPERAIAFAKRYPQLTDWVDQDCLNAVCVDRWLQLEPHWNSLVRETPDAPYHFHADAVLHYLGPDKPWLATSGTGRSAGIAEAHRLYHRCVAESGARLVLNLP